MRASCSSRCTFSLASASSPASARRRPSSPHTACRSRRSVSSSPSSDDFINFWKNITIAGGFLMVFAFGPGRYSVDRRDRS
ncbi:MAG: DoxX family protein [Chloroflexi bacterium]|nr:MAG: DoxX family protein [Chloroflexota bacterium]